MKNAALIVTFLFAAGAAQAGWFDECEHRAHRSAQIDMAGVSHVVVIAKAGSLRVEGRDGVRTVAASGEACSSDEDVLRDITLTATRSGSTATIEAHVPSLNGWSFFGGSNAALDFTVTLPSNVSVDIDDTSGGMTVVNVGTCSIDDTSGEIDVRRVHGDLTIRDTSGAIIVEDVAGGVHIPRDTSGEIEVRRVGGGVAIDEDSSGAVTISNVKRNVFIGHKGSGSIYVSDVGGDFTVDHKGSGGVDYVRVAGHVSIPERRHRR
ncbi:MAG TPA: hypothetical protein VGR95_22160 [Thermoanaerobaculia bacterium]|jgi:hypothetical protein|nr:hypothetical protein [Thermoanaerobaculia bacterium]